MSSDNFNMIVQTPDGQWIASPNHSMSDLMGIEEARAYKHAVSLLHSTDRIYDTQQEAYAALDDEYSEYGTFSHEYKKWFEDYE